MSARKILVTLFSGNVLAQLIMMAFAPIISRLYSETEMGIYAAYVTVIAITVKIASLSLEKAIPLEQDTKLARQLLRLNFMIVWLVCAILFGVYMIFDWSILRFVGINPSVFSMLLLSLGIAFTSMIQIYNYQNMALEQYRTLSLTKSMQLLGTGVLQSILSFRPTGLLLGDIGGKLLSLLVLKHVSRKARLEKVVFSWADMVFLLRKYRNFMLFSAPSGLVNTLALQVPQLFIIAIFATAAGGQYALVQRVILVPISLLSISIAQFFYSFATKCIANQPGQVYRMYMQITWKLCVAMFLPVLLLAMFSPVVFPFVFGANWREAGELAQTLSMLLFTQAVFGATSQILYVTNKQKLQMILELCKLASIIGVFMIMQADFLQTMLFYSVIISFFNVVVWYLGRRTLVKLLNGVGKNDE
ncbi:lipopolysaccharide biosynthesis protein [Listeria booriae]|uniref:Oligosaccharide flippase family protein n=1 Tax=Listeria booriae TaxID=1552123 RepID=A0A842F9A7_9LIST|nr:oligosaccharide flippase family protein [Listeria booriae]MBC2240521.1 oligosaccharide flippase family protein [Listeria booriae]